MKKNKYLFLDSSVYAPEHIGVSFGSKVVIDKKEGDEVWFTFLSSKKKGYVVYPSMFVEATKENIRIVNLFKEKMKLSKRLENDAYKLLHAMITGIR